MAPFKSSLARSATKLFGVFRDRDLSLRGFKSESRVPPPPFSASGGTKTTSGDQTIHTFSFPNSDNLVTSGSPSTDVKILVIGGGGGGGGTGYSSWYGGGGGAGGYVYATGVTLDGSGTTYNITVGDKGVAQDTNNGGDGGDSIFGSNVPTATKLTAKGGGGGGIGDFPSTHPDAAGRPGGSGGGSGSHYSPPSTAGGTATQPGENGSFTAGTLVANVGYAGGAEPGGNSGDGVGGGGGGAGGVGLVGTAPSNPERSAGGPGVPNSITGSDVTYCQGGRSHPLGGDAPAPLSTAGSGGNGVDRGVGVQPNSPGIEGIVIVSYPT